jgi:hypothetical protein
VSRDEANDAQSYQCHPHQPDAWMICANEHGSETLLFGFAFRASMSAKVLS